MRILLSIITIICVSLFLKNSAEALSQSSLTTTAPRKDFILPDYYKKYTLSFGDPNAPIKIHKFFSFMCPSCLLFHKHHFPIIQKHFIDTGKVYWTFVPYVIDIDTLYVMAAMATCPEKLKIKIFETTLQSALNWTESDNKENIIHLLKECGVPAEILENVFAEASYESVLKESFEFQEYITVDGTPTLFINGEEAPGIPGAKKLSKMLSDILNKKTGESE